MFRASSAHHQESLTVHTASSFCVCVYMRHCLTRHFYKTRFLFSIYMFITLHVSSVKRSSSGVPHRTYSLQFLCLCLFTALSYKTFLQDKIFFIYMCITLHVSSVKRSSSGVPHLTYSLQFLCLCLLAALSYKTVPQTDTNTETGGCMYGEVLLMMSASR
jgi:hypothetical protein